MASTADRLNWVAAMMLHARLGDRDKRILTRLAMHFNLKTARCDPSMGLLALELSLPGGEESGRRVLRRSLEKAERLGWVVRHARHGGDARYRNQSNQYELGIPLSAVQPPQEKRPDKNANTTGQKRQYDRTPEFPRIMKL
jgi:hypothetical protein